MRRQPRWRIVHSESSLGWGGQEHRVLAELTGFRRRGHEVWLLTPTGSESFRRAQAAHIPVQALNSVRWQLPYAVLQIALWLRRVRVNILNTHSSRDGWVAGLAGRLAGVPFILRTRHIDVEYPNRWLSRHVYSTLADHVLTTSQKINQHLRDALRLPPDHVSTVPTGIDLERFVPEGPAARLLPALGGPECPIIGMVSVLRSWKGHFTFLEAAGLLRREGVSARFVVVGEGPMRAAIEERIRALDLGGIVTLVGHREDVPEVLRALSILAIPSTQHEGVPQIGLQALATRTPVIGSDVGGIPEIIRPGETGRIFPGGDAAALARTIWEALSDPKATAGMAARGRAAVEAAHGLETMLTTLEGLYARRLTL